MNGKVLILYNSLSENPQPDELDVLDQVEAVEKALIRLAYRTDRLGIGLNLDDAKRKILDYCPDLAFNLVEGIEGKGRLIAVIPSLLETMRIPFTGSGMDAVFQTSDKVLAKKILRFAGLPTGDWYGLRNITGLSPEKQYIIKPLWEDGSVGISEEGVFSGDDPELREYISELNPDDYFIEEYIHGREFNISLLGGKDGPLVLPPAEIRFIDFPADRPHVLGYKSKWDETSFEYRNTVRSFEFQEEDTLLLEKIKAVSLSCWQLFGLKGYVRVDIRVNSKGEIFILEVNANPCISPDAGFIAACEKAGLEFTEVISRILFDAKSQ